MSTYDRGHPLANPGIARGLFRTSRYRANTKAFGWPTVRQIRAKRLARLLESVPVSYLGQRWDGHQFAMIEPGKRGVDQILGIHHHGLRQVLDG